MMAITQRKHEIDGFINGVWFLSSLAVHYLLSTEWFLLFKKKTQNWEQVLIYYVKLCKNTKSEEIIKMKHSDKHKTV